MNIDYLVESSKGLQNLSVEDSLTALMAMHLAENGTFKKDEYISEVQELKTKLLDSINSAIEKHQPEGFVMLDITEGIKSIEQKIDYHLNALSAKKPTVSDFVYVLSYWFDDGSGVNLEMDDEQVVFMGDEHAEEKIRGFITVPKNTQSDFSGIFTGEVDEVWIADYLHIKKCELL